MGPADIETLAALIAFFLIDLPDAVDQDNRPLRTNVQTPAAAGAFFLSNRDHVPMLQFKPTAT